MKLIIDKIKEILQSDDDLGYCGDPHLTLTAKLRRAICLLAEEIDALKNIQ